jgi:hypothetical protein
VWEKRKSQVRNLKAWRSDGGFHALEQCAKTTGFSGTNDNKAMLPLTI